MNNIFLEGAFCVDSRNEFNVKIIDVKIRRWFKSIEDVQLLKDKINQLINPQNLSFDEGMKILIEAGRNYDPKNYQSINIRELML